MTRRRSVEQMTWAEYVAHWSQGEATQAAIARRCGINGTTISRWLNGDTSAITSQSVAKFARAFHRPVIEAFVVAGFLTPEEAEIELPELNGLSGYTNQQLMRELSKRLREQDEELQLRDSGNSNNDTASAARLTVSR